MSDRTAINPPMSDEHTIQRVRELRARGLSPKEIARSLAIKPALASEFVRRLAAERDAADPDTDRFECLINPGWSTALKINDHHPEWRDPSAGEGAGGLITALVARRRRHRRGATVCVYLVDVYCLGVKNAMGPHNLDEQRLRRLADHIFKGLLVTWG